MNATNRAVNRIVLLVVGAVLVAAGALAVAMMIWPQASDAWRASVTAATDAMVQLHRSTRLSEATTVSWLSLGVLAALLLIVVLSVVVIARLGGGRGNAVIRLESETGPQGAVTIHEGFASDAITRSLAGREDVLASRIRTRRVRGGDLLHVSVTPRKNTCPAEIAATVTELIDNLAAVTGRDTPTVVSIRSGIRSRWAADRSRVN